MLRFFTAGESHGKGLVALMEGMVAGLPLTKEDIARDLARRRQGFGRGPRMALEGDNPELLSGVRYGKTIGSPIALFIPNREWESWQAVMSPEPVAEPAPPLTRLRPGHADLAGVLKYGFSDVRPVLERSSARETAARVACGAIARRLLAEMGMEVHSHTLAIGSVAAAVTGAPDWAVVETSPVRCADLRAGEEMVQAIEQAREAGDTLGGVFEVVATGVPPGLGGYAQWDRRLDGRLAQAMMSIPAVKGVEIGIGFEAARLPGSRVHDVILPGGRPFRRGSNRAGGVEGGVSNGEDIVVRGAVKPIPTLAKPLPSVDLATGKETPAHYERSDVCVVPAAGVVAEAVVSLVLAEAFLEKFGGDSLEETRCSYRSFLASLTGKGEA